MQSQTAGVFHFSLHSTDRHTIDSASGGAIVHSSRMELAPIGAASAGGGDTKQPASDDLGAATATATATGSANRVSPTGTGTGTNKSPKKSKKISPKQQRANKLPSPNKTVVIVPPSPATATAANANASASSTDSTGAGAGADGGGGTTRPPPLVDLPIYTPVIHTGQRPDFGALIETIVRANNQPSQSPLQPSDIAVVSCGPIGMTQQIEALCHTLQLHHHSETFILNKLFFSAPAAMIVKIVCEIIASELFGRETINENKKQHEDRQRKALTTTKKQKIHATYQKPAACECVRKAKEKTEKKECLFSPGKFTTLVWV